VETHKDIEWHKSLSSLLIIMKIGNNPAHELLSENEVQHNQMIDQPINYQFIFHHCSVAIKYYPEFSEHPSVEIMDAQK
jgi:hypothetical protein